MPESFDFAVSGINHPHIYGQVDAMLDAGCRLTAFYAPEDELAADFARAYPQARRVADEAAILEDPAIRLVVGAGIPGERAAMALRAMHAGKDVMVDKPGCTTEDQLAELRRVQAETGRIFSICYSEHYLQPCTVAASRLVAEGAIGRVVSTIGLGPHRIGHNPRPAWFWDTARGGEILVDIASHQFEQFLHFTGATSARILAAVEDNLAHPEHAGWNDHGHATVASDHATGFVRVDWMTPAGSPAWGDGRLFLTGTEGVIELRKYMDVEGRPGGDHLFLTDGKGTRYIDAKDTHMDYGERLRDDVLNRTETAMPQAHCFLAMQLALEAAPDRRAARRPHGGFGMSRLRVGVVGSGIGASHIEGYAALPELYEVAALCDLDPVRGPEVAGRFGIDATTTRYDELLRRDDLDVIDICTPSGMHQAQTIAALEAGFHVVVEKPVAKSLAEMDTVEAAEAASGRRVCPIFQYRFGHGIQKLHHLMGKGLAGPASVATAETHWWRGDAYYQAARWRGTFAGELGGCLATHAIHIHDILCEVLGPPTSVHARTSNRRKRNETEDAAVLSLGFASGAFATSSVTLSSRQELSRLRFVFEDSGRRKRARSLQPGPRSVELPERRPRRRGDDRGGARRLRAAARALSGAVPPHARRPFLRWPAAGDAGRRAPRGRAADRRLLFRGDRRGGHAAAAARASLLRRLDRGDEAGGHAWLSSSCARSSSASARPR